MLFTERELKSFGLFVSSPYFNRLNNVYRLYTAIKKYHPEFSSRTFTKENIFGKIFPGQKYDDIKMRALFSYLFTLAEKFLCIEHYSSNSINTKIDTLDAEIEKGDRVLASKNLKDAEGLLHQYLTRNEGYYHMLYKVIYQKNVLSGFFSGKMNFQKETDAFGISKERVRQLEERTIAKLKGRLLACPGLAEAC
jgi:DNA-directed RNA polymerase specialized sigma subunit